MKKKIGIITFHNAHNYGAVLQAYALNIKLKSLGFDVGFIEYNLSPIHNHYKKYPSFSESGNNLLRYLKNLICFSLDYNRKVKRYNAFSGFIEKYFQVLNVTNKKFYLSAVVIGSDQVWNPNITEGYDDIFFGKNKNIFTDRRISYAASMGSATSEDNLTEEYYNLLSNLDNIGVREQGLANLFEDKFNLSVDVNIDPTLLLNKEEWNKISSKPLCNEKYVLVYEVEPNVETKSIVDYLSKVLSIKIKVISSITNYKLSKDIITTASPNDFLSLFKNASFVVTTSFHGTVFSIINNVPFVTVKFNNGIDTRASNLLLSLGLDERHVNNVDDVEKLNIDVDFTFAENKLNKLRYQSELYISEKLSDIN
ncbi:TPA: polysaccharide pyruvyl transferase family protein [Photobacterium damselae]